MRAGVIAWGMASVLSGAPLQAAEGKDPPFAERCAAPNVVLCDPLDDGSVRVQGADAGSAPNLTLPAALKGRFRDWRWCTHGKKLAAPPEFDRKVKASGSGSVRFTIVGGSADDGAGYCQINFTPDNSIQFGEGDTFYVQFKVRFSCELLYEDCDPGSPGYKTTRRRFAARNGSATAYKISIVNSGDHPLLESPVNSCTNQHLVLIGDARGVLQGYHSCGWYDGHHGDLGLDRRTGRHMVDLQPRRFRTGGPLQICHKAGSPAASRVDPTRDCYLLSADEWLTITQQVSIGRWVDAVTSKAKTSNIKVWVAREGEAPELVIDFDRNLRRPEAPFMKYGKIWLIPFFTNKDINDLHPTGMMWFDELLVASGSYRAVP